MLDHDRLFKELLATFLPDFLELFAPELAGEIEPGGAARQAGLHQLGPRGGSARAGPARDATTVLDTVPRQLGHEPTVQTRNRKPLKTNPVAPWELRIGHLRVYFDVKEKPERVVTIHAVGLKDRNRVLVGGEEVKLQ